MDRNGKRWSDAEDRLFVDLFDSGASDEQIAARLGRSKVAISEHRRCLRLIRIAPDDARCWSPSDLATMAQLLDQGASDADIAAAVGRTERAIANKRHGLGWLRKATRVRRRIDNNDLERRHAALLDYVEILLPLARSRGEHEIAELLCEALEKASSP